MEQNLVGYLLKALDPETQRQVEDQLRDNPQARQHLELLRRALEPLAADRDGIEPPADLAVRTLARVAEYRCRPLPQAPPSRSTLPFRRWWRRADVLVAAGIAFALLLVLPPALSQLRQRQAIAECKDNLRRFHQALVAYGDGHNKELPRLEDQAPRNVAGVFVPILNDAGLLGPDVSIRCPGNGHRAPERRSLQELESMPAQEFAAYAPCLTGCYSYALGYRDAAGNLHGYRYGDNDNLPIMADRPLLQGEGGAGAGRGNSPNHGGGQNVLRLGGSVDFCTERTVGVNGDDIFLNQAGKVAAGLNLEDSVLGTGADQP